MSNAFSCVENSKICKSYATILDDILLYPNPDIRVKQVENMFEVCGNMIIICINDNYNRDF